MKHPTSLFRSLTMLILLSLVFSLFTAQSPVQAAPKSLVTLTFDNTVYGGLPGQPITTTLTEVFGNTSNEKNNIYSDILFTLPTNIDLGGVSVRALNGANQPIGSVITLNTGQTYFWASTFGGVLARKSIRKISGSSYTYHFVFTPSAAQAGRDILITAQAPVAKIGFLNTNPANWKPASSDPVSATLRVFAGPFLTSTDIAGPYTTNISRTFQVRIHNPLNGAAYSGLHLGYQISNFGLVAPNILVLRYRTSTDGIAWSTYTDIAPIATSGEFGPADGYTLAAGNTEYIEVDIRFNNDTSLFPISLTLRNSQGNLQDTLSAVMAVNPTRAQLFSSDLETPFNAGIPQEFHVTAINDAEGGVDYPAVYIKFIFQNMDSTMISQLEFFDGASWQNMPRSAGTPTDTAYGPFPLGNTVDLATTVKFRANFNHPGSYTVLVDLLRNNANGPSIADTLISKTITVVAAKPSLDLSDLTSNSPLTESVEQPFVVTLNNPSTGTSYSSLNLGLAITGVSAANVTNLQYSLNNGANWQAVPVSAGAGGNAVGTINPANWTITPNSSVIINFRLTIAQPADNLIMTMKLYNQTTLLVEQSVYFDVASASIPVTENPMFYLPIIVH